MKRIIISLCMALLAAGFACADFLGDVQNLVTEGQELGSPPAQQEPEENRTTTAHEPSAFGEDDHYIQQDDVFISEQPLGTHEWIYVQLSKMVTPPDSKTKGEGEFFKVTDGNKQWTRNYWKSRIAGTGELKLGTVVIMFEGASRDGVYQAPESKENARNGNWFMAKVTDLSDLYKGFITVSGGYKASPNNIRVIFR